MHISMDTGVSVGEWRSSNDIKKDALQGILETFLPVTKKNKV